MNEENMEGRKPNEKTENPNRETERENKTRTKRQEIDRKRDKNKKYERERASAYMEKPVYLQSELFAWVGFFYLRLGLFYLRLVFVAYGHLVWSFLLTVIWFGLFYLRWKIGLVF